ncbi:MAG: hypothetical protein KBC98_02495 [Candidatus Pacebacteria bacterium]|nr:hypothetical protein [Candidatus Paceibacterota bacterium]
MQNRITISALDYQLMMAIITGTITHFCLKPKDEFRIDTLFNTGVEFQIRTLLRMTSKIQRLSEHQLSILEVTIDHLDQGEGFNFIILENGEVFILAKRDGLVASKLGGFKFHFQSEHVWKAFDLFSLIIQTYRDPKPESRQKAVEEALVLIKGFTTEE